MSVSAENDPHGATRFEHEYRFQRATTAQRRAAHEYRKASTCTVSRLYVNITGATS